MAVRICPWMDGQIHDMAQGARKVMRLRPLCLLLLWLFYFSTPLTALADNTCSSDKYDETTTIRHIYDGDTLRLTNGRKIRLIGINTPEMGKKDKAAEPFAIEAKNALKSLFKDNKAIALLYGKEIKDRYDRFLAHGFLANGQNIQTTLLQQGLARAINVPPNTQFASCYLEIEHQARCSKAGLWQNTNIIQAKNLKRHHIGFHLVQGEVKSININNKGIWLNIDNKLSIGIRPDNQSLFDIKALNDMLNQTIIVRGWLNKSNKSTPFYLRLRHPLSLQLFSAFSCS